MATKYINAQFSLFERAKSTIDGKKMLEVLDILNWEVDDFFKDVPFREANMGLMHRLRRVTSKPTGAHRKFNEGVTAEQPTTQTVFEPVSLIEARNEIDEDELDTIENGKEERATQDKLFVSGMGKTIVSEMISGSRGDDVDEIDGLAVRLNSTSQKNVISAGGSTALTSIYFVDWNPRDGAFGLYPPKWLKNAMFGIDVRNKGKEKVFDSNSKAYYAYVTQFKAWLGLAVADNFKIARLCNIESAKTHAFDENSIIELLNLCKMRRETTRAYCNTYLATQIDIAAKDKSNVWWSTSEVFGKPVRTFQGVPFRVLDPEIITIAESSVS